MSPSRPSTWMISWANHLPLHRTASSTSFRTNSSPTFTGFVTIGFNRPDFKKKFKEIYGYELGVPVNWSAYEDIAEFFTEQVKEIDGVGRLTAITTTARRLRTSAGGSPMPGSPWPVPATKACPTASRWTNGASASKAAVRWVPASAAAAPPTARRPSMRLRKYMEWLRKYAPPGALGHGLLPVPAVSGQRQRRPADLLVHGIRAGHGRPGPDGQCRRDPEMAHGPLAPRTLLGRRDETGLPGLRVLDSAEEHAGRPPQGRLALCAVLA